MAHAIFIEEARHRALSAEVYSAGTLDFSDQQPLIETTRTCRYFKTEPPKNQPTWIRELPLDSIKRFFVMEHDHARALIAEHGIAEDRITLLGTFDPHRRGAEISDPFFSYNEAVYRRTYEQIRDCIIGYLDSTDELTPTR
jgi:protein-tyrosine-phosphatase